MNANWIKRLTGALGLGALVVAAAWFAWPRPIAVDLGSVAKGPMEVTIDDEAKTRVRHVFTVSAPIAGKVLRISPPRHVGDPVTADETIVAVMQPMAPGFHDVRTHQELQAALAAADAAVSFAEAEIRRIEAALAFSRREFQRATALARTEVIAGKALDKARFDVVTNEAALASAKAQLAVQRNERASVAARVGQPPGVAAQEPSCCIQLLAPATGRILKIVQESEGVVQAGTPLLDIGDPRDLEIVADLLSSDAVRLKADFPVRIDGWGGLPIRGRLNRVDPAGFLKVSALGIEEQRVRTVIDFADPPEAWAALGHDYRVIVHVTTWKAENALTVPVAALFRKGNDWAVFAVKGGRAQTVLVKIGQRNSRTAEVESGLSAGDLVVLHPSDRISEGVAVAQRDVR